ncbi:hypothetical protein [Marinomonas spartinae]|uniref:hypothetical protein n=1 Tax=Marinomonas spartinae TaxID=1792290 RepID=UPI0018F131EC|nr:hypothetical protein [Marinomonas spartinae]MBJ7555391.1 hypothetical protein [Marinomonas spartinae]
MKVKLHSTSDVIINDKVETLKAGEHNVSDHVARKLIKNGVASEVLATPVKATKTKASGDET